MVKADSLRNLIKPSEEAEDQGVNKDIRSSTSKNSSKLIIDSKLIG